MVNTRASLFDGQGDAQLLLAAGIIACPLFIGMSLIQALTRQGFDLKHYAIRNPLGYLGWSQDTISR